MTEIDFCNIMAYNHKYLCMWVFLMESSILYIRSSQIGNIRPKRHINRFKNPTAQSELIFDNMHTKSQWKLCVPHRHEVRLCILWNPSLSFSTHVYKLAVSHKHTQTQARNDDEYWWELWIQQTVFMCCAPPRSSSSICYFFFLTFCPPAVSLCLAACFCM